MKRLPSRLLLAFAYCVVTCRSASSDKLVVTQTPDVSAKEGEMVEIICCWTENSERVRVNWMKSQTGNKEDLNMKNQSEVFQKKEENKCSSLTFPSISREDAGTYICRVTIEIPVLTVAHGNGTVITVIFKEKTSDKTAGDKVRDTSGDKARETSRDTAGDTAKDKARETARDTAGDTARDTARDTAGDTVRDFSSGPHQDEVLIHLLRSLPILTLILAFFTLYYLGTKAQKQALAAPGNKPTLAQRREKDQEEEEEREERVTEAADEPAEEREENNETI